MPLSLKIAPSILSADFADLGRDCEDVLAAGADWLHIDVMDGQFVPNISLGVPVLAGLAKRVPAFYDVHLMIADPIRYIEPFAQAGADLITFHLESRSDARAAIAAIRAAGCRPAVSIKPATPAQAVFPYLDEVDLVLVMSVEPGFGGQKFMPAAVEKIAAIRAQAHSRGLEELLVEVDGGIAPDTAALCARAGADVLVAGSAVFGQADRAAAIAAIRSACKEEDSL